MDPLEKGPKKWEVQTSPCFTIEVATGHRGRDLGLEPSACIQDAVHILVYFLADILLVRGITFVLLNFVPPSLLLPLGYPFLSV